MSYVVLARKWRPLRFEDLIGQDHVARTLLACPHPVQGLVVAGRDAALAADLRRLTAATAVRVLGYVPDVRPLMGAADVLVTKAGGMTLAEALAAELPLLLYGSLPGHERRNERFAARNGLALVARTRAELATANRERADLAERAARLDSLLMEAEKARDAAQSDVKAIRRELEEERRKAASTSEESLRHNNDVLRGIMERQNADLEQKHKELIRLRRARFGVRLAYAGFAIALRVCRMAARADGFGQRLGLWTQLAQQPCERSVGSGIRERRGQGLAPRGRQVGTAGRSREVRRIDVRRAA